MRPADKPLASLVVQQSRWLVPKIQITLTNTLAVKSAVKLDRPKCFCLCWTVGVCVLFILTQVNVKNIVGLTKISVAGTYNGGQYLFYVCLLRKLYLKANGSLGCLASYQYGTMGALVREAAFFVCVLVNRQVNFFFPHTCTQSHTCSNRHL